MEVVVVVGSIGVSAAAAAGSIAGKPQGRSHASGS